MSVQILHNFSQNSEVLYQRVGSSLKIPSIRLHSCKYLVVWFVFMHSLADQKITGSIAARHTDPRISYIIKHESPLKAQSHIKLLVTIVNAAEIK